MSLCVMLIIIIHIIALMGMMSCSTHRHAVTVAADGGQGLAKFRAIKPDLVLLDVMMPVMDGWSVCREIRSEAQTLNDAVFSSSGHFCTPEGC